jgi:rRNA maturation endonuclease Nob1
MNQDLVTVATYRFVLPAEVARLALEQQGVQVFVVDSNVVTTDFFLGNAVGYIKLQVPRSQADLAVAILHKQPTLLDGGTSESHSVEDQVVQCLSCGATLPEEDDRCPACGWCYGGGDSEDSAEPGDAMDSR